jgi:hypothetical protein
MRTSFHHQSEAQPPNGPLTAATSPDTPSPGPTTQSCATGDFLKGLRKASNWRGSVRRFVLGDRIVTVGRSFLRIFLWPRNPVSRKRRPREAETRFECRLRRRKSEHLVLPRPLGGHVGEAGHSHAMRQPPRDGRFHEIGRQKGKRDRHVDLPNAAPLALGDAFRICVRVGKKFVEPTAARLPGSRP